MRLTILGSGTNVHPRRAAAGYLVKTDHLLLLDFGPRTLAKLIALGVNRHRIQHILFSHLHADHVADFIPFFFDAVFYSKFVRRRPDLTILGPRGTRRLFTWMLKTFPGFDAARFTTHIREVRDEVFFIGRTRILAQTVKHSPNLHCLGFRVEYGGKALVYSGDAMYCTSLVELCRDATVAVLDCSFPANRPGPNHLHAGDCGRVAHEARVQQLVLSHFYPIAERYDVRAQAGRLFAGRILKGRDGLSLTL